MREELDRAIGELRNMLVDMSERADGMLGQAVIALSEGDRVRAEEVIYADRAVDQRHVEVQHAVLTTVALQSPVGRDLRLLTAFLHSGLHLERMADHAVSVARGAIRLLDLPRDESIVELLVEMSGYAREVGRTALQALLTLDEALARSVAVADDRVDRLEMRIFEQLVGVAGADAARLPWAAQMIGLSRRTERYADHGVDIAEQAVFAVTGITVELLGEDQKA
jgi:phosphate transport system protein